MKTRQIWNYAGIVLTISFGLGILIHFNTIIFNFGLVPGTEESTSSIPKPWSAAGEVFISSMVAFVTFIINYFIIRPFESPKQISPKRILIALFITLVSVSILSDAFFAIKHFISGESASKGYNLLFSFRDLFTGIVVIIAIIFIKTVYDRQTVRIENEILKNEKLLSKYESLKNQISPHFLFNSLTALRELVDQNQKDAKLYIGHLSSVLRYTLTSVESQSKSLQEELEIADSYFHLVKIRFGSNLRVETLIDEKYINHRLPPLAIQTLLENAIKHNEISKKNPFTIKIETGDNQSLIVSNQIQERVSKEHSTGIGLSNLSKQYHYLAGNDINISNRNNEFRVELPLLIPSLHEGINY